MSMQEKIQEIARRICQEYNGYVTARYVRDDPHKIVFTLKIKYITREYYYLVDEEAIEMTEAELMAKELIPLFETLIWESIRR